LAALLHSTPSAGVSQTLQRGTQNGITELLQRAPPIFGWAAITGVRPHCSCFFALHGQHIAPIKVKFGMEEPNFALFGA